MALQQPEDGFVRIPKERRSWRVRHRSETDRQTVQASFAL